MIRYLVERGADLEAATDWKQTPLHVAKNFNVIKFLVERGANINARDSNGCTPLNYAKSRCNSLLVAYLIEHGAK